MINFNFAINFSTLKKGGGQNVALNFLNEFSKNNKYRNNVFFIVANNSFIHKYLIENYELTHIITVSVNPVKRTFQELFQISYLLNKFNIKVVYSYFGFGFYSNKIPQIVGSADSNLYYPNLNFWSQYSGYKLLIKKLIDKYRIYGLKKASGVVFETNILERKFHEVFHFNGITRTIKPSISIPSINNKFDFPKSATGIAKGLLLCSWQLNKNVMLIPSVAFELKKRGISFMFTITASLDDSIICRDFLKLVKKYGVDDYIFVSGSVSKDCLKSLYLQTDIVLLLSKLESFSNNIIEAWTFERALLVADEEWSHDICQNAADYVDRENPKEVANHIECILMNKEYKNVLIENGRSILKTYPTIEQRTKQELDFIEYIYEKVY